MPRPPSKKKEPDMIEQVTQKMSATKLMTTQEKIVQELQQEVKSLKGIIKAFEPLIKQTRADTETAKTVRPPKK